MFSEKRYNSIVHSCYCLYCEKVVDNRLAHLIKVHRNKKEVADILTTSAYTNRKVWMNLYKLMNFVHNFEVLRSGEGALFIQDKVKLVVKPGDDLSHLAPCSICYAIHLSQQKGGFRCSLRSQYPQLVVFYPASMRRVLLYDLEQAPADAVLVSCQGLGESFIHVLTDDRLIHTLARYLLVWYPLHVDIFVFLLVSLLLWLRGTCPSQVGDLQSFLTASHIGMLSDGVEESASIIKPSVAPRITASLQWLVLHCIQILRSHFVRQKRLQEHRELTEFADNLVGRWAGAKPLLLGRKAAHFRTVLIDCGHLNRKPLINKCPKVMQPVSHDELTMANILKVPEPYHGVPQMDQTLSSNPQGESSTVLANGNQESVVRGVLHSSAGQRDNCNTEILSPTNHDMGTVSLGNNVFPGDHSRPEDVSPVDHSRSEDVSPVDHSRSEDVSPVDHSRSKDVSPADHSRSKDVLPVDHSRSKDVSPDDHSRSKDVLPVDHSRSEDNVCAGSKTSTDSLDWSQGNNTLHCLYLLTWFLY